VGIRRSDKVVLVTVNHSHLSRESVGMTSQVLANGSTSGLMFVLPTPSLEEASAQGTFLMSQEGDTITEP
jgi:hypothetical protein